MTTYTTLATQNIESKGNVIEIKKIKSSQKWSLNKPNHEVDYFSFEINGEFFGGHRLSEFEVNWYLTEYTDNIKLSI